MQMLQSYAQTMDTSTRSPPHLLLAGGGHVQLAVLHALAWQPNAALRVTLVSPVARTLYSGMVPGWMAGRYPLEALQLPVDRLAAAAGVQHIESHVVALDADARRVQLADGRQLNYDLLSLDVGGSIDIGPLAGAPDLLAVRPIEAFAAAWPEMLQKAAGHGGGWRLAVVGAGAAGVEVALAARAALHRADAWSRVTLVEGPEGLLPGHAEGVRARAAKALAQRGVERVRGPAKGHADGLLLTDGTLLAADAVIACTGSRPPAWLASSGLALDGSGRVRVDAHQRSVSHSQVFAAGDVCAREDRPLPASGVHAVRAGPVLAHNLLASLSGRTLQRYEPPRYTLYLLACGDGTAIASWGPLSAEGRWVWRWKDHIDRRFMQRQIDSPASVCKEPGC
jgi:pyridine nucleotide-disulfide oxidoreductase family protein